MSGGTGGLGEDDSQRFAFASAACAGGGNQAKSWNTGRGARKLWLQQPGVRANPREGAQLGKLASGCGEAQGTEGQCEDCLPPHSPGHLQAGVSKWWGAGASCVPTPASLFP